MTRRAPPQIAPPEYENADVAAIQALARGDASPEAQRRALDWIINAASATYDQSFHPDSARLTDFAEGRRFVGNQVVKLTKLNLSKLQKA
jgi:hypothetical protein